MTLFQQTFEPEELGYVNEMHVACVLLLDGSGSTEKNDAIGKLNAGVRAFKEQTENDASFDERTRACIDIAIVSFGGEVRVEQDFAPVSHMSPPELTAGGSTPLGEAINRGLDMIEEQKDKYKTLGTPYYRPWLFCITDGEPTDSWEGAAARLREMEEQKKVLGYCVGVEGFNRAKMQSIFTGAHLFELKNLNFTALFEFLSNSLAAVPKSNEASGTMAVLAPSDLQPIQISF